MSEILCYDAEHQAKPSRLDEMICIDSMKYRRALNFNSAPGEPVPWRTD
jgi:hypothetical protein